MEPVNINDEDIIYDDAIIRDLVSIFKGLYEVGETDLFADITKQELKLTRLVKDPIIQSENSLIAREERRLEYFDNWLWIWARLYKHAKTEGSRKEMESIINDALELTPASFMRFLPEIIRNHPKPLFFLEVTDSLVQIDHSFQELLDELKAIHQERQWGIKLPNPIPKPTAPAITHGSRVRPIGNPKQ